MTTYLVNKQKETCYGCWACEQSCPKKAISLVPDEEGFLYPVLDESVCVRCGICKAVCPYDNEKNSANPIAVYAIQNKNNEELIKSSSGGAFSALAYNTLAEEGAVVGCVFSNELKAEHVVASDLCDIEKMHGSKYVQSNLQDVFTKVKNILDEGKQVLFTGTPCQVDGLKRFLKKPYGNLLTVDLICHGVPSPLLLDEFVKFTENNNEKLSQIKFRNKARNGWRSEGTLCFESGKEKTFSPFRDSYYNLYYMRNCVSRRSCYSCKYAALSRVGDITIGDFWNATDFLDEDICEGGVSAMLINTATGQAAFERIKNDILFFKSDIETAQKGNHRLVKGIEPPVAREGFYNQLKKDGYEKTVSQECKYSYVIPFIKKHIPKSLKKKLKRFLG